MIDIEILTAILKQLGYLDNSDELPDKQVHTKDDSTSNSNNEMDKEGSR